CSHAASIGDRSDSWGDSSGPNQFGLYMGAHGVTDEQGRGAIEVPAARRVVLQVEAGGFLTGELAVEIPEDGPPVERTIVLQRGVKIAGRILDRDGLPLRGMHVGVYFDGPTLPSSGETDGDGCFHLEAPGYGACALLGFWPDTDASLSVAHFTVPPDRPVLDIGTITVDDRKCTLEVSVVREGDGSPVEDAEVSVAGPHHGPTPSFVVQRERGPAPVEVGPGRFRFVLEGSGRATVRVDHDDYPTTFFESIELAPDRTVHKVVALAEGGVVEGVAVRAGGTPYGNAYVLLFCEGGVRHLALTTTQANGWFRFPSVAAGRYQVWIGSEAYANYPSALWDMSLERSPPFDVAAGVLNEVGVFTDSGR
ncbi:hypothetical protein ACFL59_00860, partial [Planctomycetota bacterium]